ncbi:SDR family NAD(P)-dependent oxidoreductase [Enterobacterales bacterium BD_CKDN230030183-1A_HGKHYDSX7]
MRRFENKTVIVTGASKGMGADIAQGFGREGANVVVNYTSDAKAAQGVVDAIKSHGGRAISVKANISAREEAEALFTACRQVFGQIDILVNNAGIYAFDELGEITEESFHSMFNINVLGVINCCQLAREDLIQQNGCIVNISSTATAETPPGSLVYTASKGAVDMITRTLSKELGPHGVRVNSINPGLVVTDGTKTLDIIGSDLEQSFVDRTPLRRVGTPADITPLALFLASEEARWLTGEILYASGGIR